MDSNSYLLKLKSRHRVAHSEEQSLTDEIFETLGRKIAYPNLRKIVNEHGIHATREIFIEVVKSDAENKAGLFLWSVGKNRVLWKQ